MVGWFAHSSSALPDTASRACATGTGTGCACRLARRRRRSWRMRALIGVGFQYACSRNPTGVALSSAVAFMCKLSLYGLELYRWNVTYPRSWGNLRFAPIITTQAIIQR